MREGQGQRVGRVDAYGRPFQLQQRSFDGNSAAVSGQRTRSADNPVAGNHHPDLVGAAGSTHGPDGIGSSNPFGDLRVAASLAVGNLQHGVPDLLLKVRAQRTQFEIEADSSLVQILVQLPVDVPAPIGPGFQPIVQAGRDPQKGGIRVAFTETPDVGDRTSRVHDGQNPAQRGFERAGVVTHDLLAVSRFRDRALFQERAGTVTGDPGFEHRNRQASALYFHLSFSCNEAGSPAVPINRQTLTTSTFNQEEDANGYG